MTKTILRAVIAEDDPRHAATLKTMLQQMPVPVEVTAMCTSVKEAYDSITRLKPDIVFLDVELDFGQNGFDLLKLFPVPEFSVIFTTQHTTRSNFISAIRACAFDFLIKPVSKMELEDTLLRYNQADGILQTKTLKRNIESAGEQTMALIISATDGKTSIETENIMYIESSGAYTTIYLRNAVNNKLEYFTSKSIKEREAEVVHSDIIRVHREWLVNLKYSIHIANDKDGGATITLQNGRKVPVSKSRKNDVLDRWKRYRRGN